MTDACPDRNDIFNRSADFHSRGVGTGVQAETGPGKPGLHVGCQRLVGGSDYERGRIAAGHLTGEAYDRAWAGAACLVLPSEWYEVRPMVIHEACARGKAVVSTRLGTIPEIVEEGVTGLLVPPASPAELGAALMTLIGDPARAEAMGRAGPAPRFGSQV